MGYKYELKKLSIEKIIDGKYCAEFHFREIGLVLLSKESLDEKVLSTLELGISVLAKIEEAPIAYVRELYLLTPLYKK